MNKSLSISHDAKDLAFLRIVITPEEFIDDEANKIEKILDNGINYVHIRKPNSSAKGLIKLIESIDPMYHPRIKLHDHFELGEYFHLGGVQLNSRNPIPPEWTEKLSCSCHSIDEIEDIAENGLEMEYITLSPIFDSISKKGYQSAFNLEKVSDKIIGKNVIALGGVTPTHFPLLKKSGFYGAAMLGCVWKDTDLFCKQLNSY